MTLTHRSRPSKFGVALATRDGEHAIIRSTCDEKSNHQRDRRQEEKAYHPPELAMSYKMRKLTSWNFHRGHKSHQQVTLTLVDVLQAIDRDMVSQYLLPDAKTWKTLVAVSRQEWQADKFIFYVCGFFFFFSIATAVPSPLCRRRESASTTAGHVTEPQRVKSRAKLKIEVDT